MPNWCSTAYAIEGDAKEIKSLYELMKRLEDMEKPSVEGKTFSGKRLWDYMAGMPRGCLGQRLAQRTLPWLVELSRTGR